jgi:predicted nuclease of predicted toxin-antitoxin system
VKVLLDENLPHRLRVELAGHEVFTAAFMGWAGVKNGELLRLVETNGFGVFVTADRKMKDQQNLAKRPFGMVYLTAQEWPMISARVPEILSAVDGAVAGSFQVVDCGEFRR